MESNINDNLLARLEDIASTSANCNLDFSKLSRTNKHVKEISTFLSITPRQAVFFSCLAKLSLQRTVTLDNLARYFMCSILKLISFMDEIEALEKKGYIHKLIKNKKRKYSYNDIGFSVPHYTIEAIRNKDTEMLSASKTFELPGFLKELGDLLDECSSGSINNELLFLETEFLISNNRNIPFVSFVNSSLSETVSKCVIFATGLLRFQGQDRLSIRNFASSVYNDFGEHLGFSQKLASGNHELIRKGLLKIVASEFDGEKMLSLTNQSAKMLFQDYPDLLIEENERTDIIKSAIIGKKKLFFNDETSYQLKPFESILRVSRFRTYTNELKKNRLAPGITAIFYGPSGTGKTESVYQLARKTGRDIMMVDLSQTKSKWFGESEKTTKRLFDNYAELLNSREVEPILFINEADGLFTRRLDLSVRGTSSDQAINTIQNILLQALEDFKGILIATTNLTGNLDGAFERRFTYRIEFPAPDSTARKAIWKNKMPELTGRQAEILGERFSMTGGEIDIQVRQIILKKVLNRNMDVFSSLLDSCSEHHSFSGRRMIGY